MRLVVGDAADDRRDLRRDALVDGPVGEDEPPQPGRADEPSAMPGSESITIVEEPSRPPVESGPEDEDTAERPAGGTPAGP